jgi:pyruvate formate lyase activating enzyme
LPTLTDPIAPGLGRIFNLQRFSLQDGPGLRTTVFLKGCPLACAWCHNPESQELGRVGVTQESQCLGCGACDRACPGGACSHCLACVEACPSGARRMLGRDLEVAELVREALRDRIFFDQSGGGVTLSGGEPLVQAGFVAEALGALRAQGVHTALDTCGLAPTATLLEVAALADLVLFDLKHLDDASHRAWTGAGNAAILANLQALARVHPAIRVRVPVIPGVNDDRGNLAATATFVAVLGLPVDLLPYHGTGAAKFARLGRTYLLDQLEPPSPARMAEAAAPFRALGIPVSIGGTP